MHLGRRAVLPSLLTAAHNLDALHTDLAAVPDCPPKFTLLLRLPNSPNWVHEQTSTVLQGLPNAEFCVRVVPGDATLHVSRMYGQCWPVFTNECYKADGPLLAIARSNAIIVV